jgi:hypothetical protein
MNSSSDSSLIVVRLAQPSKALCPMRNSIFGHHRLTSAMHDYVGNLLHITIAWQHLQILYVHQIEKWNIAVQ